MVKNCRGQNLIEVLLSLALLVIFVAGISILAFRYWDSLQKVRDFSNVDNIISSSFEAVQSIAYNDWSSISQGTYGLDNNMGVWGLSSTPDLINNRYTRSIVISNVNRNDSCNVTSSGGVSDPDTKLITVQINWLEVNGAKQLSAQRYLTDWKNPSYCLPEEFVDLIECGGFEVNDLPEEVMALLLNAYNGGSLSCITEDILGNINIPADSAIIIATDSDITIDGNVAGRESSLLIMGIEAGVNLTGNLNNMGYLVFGDGSMLTGNLNGADNVWFLGEGNITQKATILNIILDTDANVNIGDNLDVKDSIDLSANSILTVGSDFICGDSTVAEIDPTAIVNIIGSNSCPAIQ